MQSHSNFLHLAEKNKQSALQWRSLTDEEREGYCRDASAHNCGDALLNEKKEANKIIAHLVDMVNDKKSLWTFPCSTKINCEPLT